jgi:hypothetical protein
MLLAACNSQTSSTGPASPAGPMSSEKSFALATFCAATSGLLKTTPAPGVSQGDLERIEASARKFALEDAATRGFSGSDVEKQITSMASFTGKKLTPADGTDGARQKVELETANLTAQVKAQCIPAFGKAP